MYGLPKNIDLSFFKGMELELISFGPAQIQFYFSGGIHIGLGGKLSHSSRGKDSVWEEGVLLVVAGSLLSLIGSSITSVAGLPDGTLTLCFANQEVLVLYDDSSHYESYTIRHGDDLFVV